jgi:hypothetical protein
LLLLVNAFYENLADFIGAKNCKWLQDIRIHKFENKLKETRFGCSAEICLEGWPSEDGRKAGKSHNGRTSFP